MTTIYPEGFANRGDRFLRLGLPLLVFSLFLGPLTVALEGNHARDWITALVIALSSPRRLKNTARASAFFASLLVRPALTRDVFYGRRGRINARELWEQINTCSCLNLILACIVYWHL